MKKIIVFLLLFMVVPTLGICMPHVNQYRLFWNENAPEDGVVKYYVYWRVADQSFNDSDRRDMGLITELPLDGIPLGVYFAVTAEDAAGNESSYSTEVLYDNDSVAPQQVEGVGIEKK